MIEYVGCSSILVAIAAEARGKEVAKIELLTVVLRATEREGGGR